MNKTLLLLVLLLNSSCVSVAIRPTPHVELSEQSIELGDVSIDGCEKYAATEYELNCEAKSKRLALALEKTQLFTSVSFNNSKTKYSVSIMPYNRKPYHLSLSHSPVVLLLSTVIPFWESYELGYSFTIENRKNRKTFSVNNLEKDTILFWSGSVIINLWSNRGIPGNQNKAEADHLKATILNATKEDRMPVRK